MSNTKTWFTYLLRCADNSLYAGVTTDLNRRIDEHNHSNKLGAKYTRVRRPVKLAYAEKNSDRQSACRREYVVRKLSKSKKEQLTQEFQLNNFIK